MSLLWKIIYINFSCVLVLLSTNGYVLITSDIAWILSSILHKDRFGSSSMIDMMISLIESLIIVSF